MLIIDIFDEILRFTKIAEFEVPVNGVMNYEAASAYRLLQVVFRQL